MHAVLSNWRSGCVGVVVFLLLWGALFFIAFMIAFGNETVAARTILHAIGVMLTIANPLWGVPAAYLIGALSGGR